MEMSRRDLDSPADGERQSLPHMDSSDDQTWGHENLSLSIIRAVFEMRGVHFHFRPELSIKVILKSVVPRIRTANLCFVAGRQSYSQSALHVERSEALPIGDRGCDDSVGSSIFVLTRRQGRLKERR